MKNSQWELRAARRCGLRVGMLVAFAAFAGCVDGREEGAAGTSAPATDEAASSLESCDISGESEPCYAQVPLAVGTSWQKERISGVAVDDGGSAYTEEIYTLHGATGINESPLPSQIKADLLADVWLDDAVHTVSSDIVDEILLSEQLGHLTPALEAIAEPLDGGGLELEYINPGAAGTADAWIGWCDTQYHTRSKQISKSISLGSSNSIGGGGFSGSLTTSGSASLTATTTVEVRLKRLKLFKRCIPYSLEFDGVRAQGTVQASPTVALSGSVSGAKSWEKQIAKPSLGSLDFMVGSIPVHIPLSLPVTIGLDVSASASASISYDAARSVSGSFDYTCKLSGCTGTRSISVTGSQAPVVSGSGSTRVQPSVWLQPALRAAFYHEDAAYVQLGVRPYVHGDFWAYYGNACGDVDVNGTNEQVDARTFDLDWQIHLTGQAAAFGNAPTKWNELWKSSRWHIGFWNLAGGSSAFQPILGGSSSAMVSTSQTYTARMRSCWPYEDSVTYKLAGGGSSTTKSGPANVATSISKTWSAPGTQTLSLTAVSDAHGRSFGATTQRSVQVTSLAPPSTTRTLWLRADAGVTLSNGKVSSWADQSTSDNDAYMDTASRRPSLVTSALNGKPVIRFNGAHSLKLTSALSHSAFTVFVVGKNSQLSSTFSMILGPTGSGTNGNNQLRWENGTQLLLVGLGNGMPTVKATIGNTYVYHALSARYDGAQLKVYRDGDLVSTSSFVTSGPWELNQVGAWTSQYFMVGDVAELLFYGSALSETNRASANTYLESKYAL